MSQNSQKLDLFCFVLFCGFQFHDISTNIEVLTESASRAHCARCMVAFLSWEHSCPGISTLTVVQVASKARSHQTIILKSCFRGTLKPTHVNSHVGWVRTLCARKWSNMGLQAYSDDNLSWVMYCQSPKGSKQPLKPVEEMNPELRVSLKVTWLEETDLVLESNSLGSQTTACVTTHFFSLSLGLWSLSHAYMLTTLENTQIPS